jgi:Ser/Thr protein kinase RdoA (MazF antagonist)
MLSEHATDAMHVEHELPAEVLRDWTLAPDRISLISSDGNIHWRVAQRGDAFIVRRYRTGQSLAAIEYELRILRHLHERGWPVAAPVREVSWWDDAAFALFPALTGSVRDESSIDRRERGRILARLHHDLGSLDARRQRDGWLRVDEVAATGAASLEDVGALAATCGRIRDRFADIFGSRIRSSPASSISTRRMSMRAQLMLHVRVAAGMTTW